MRIFSVLGGVILAAAWLLAPGAARVAEAQAGYPPAYGYPPSYGGGAVGARIWVENDRDYFRRGDRMNVRFSLPDDAYVAIVHIDTEGALDFVFPATPWDNEYVRGGRAVSIPARGASASMVRGRPGIGYFYLIASPYPLDFASFRGARSSPWEWGYAGRRVYGDPFLALDQISRMLVPGWPYTAHQVDYYGYHVEGLHRYPAYACAAPSTGYGWGWSGGASSCDRMDFFLREQPYYYDTRRYQGDRRTYLRRYDDLDPRHGFKEAPDRRLPQPQRGVAPSDLRGDSRDADRVAPAREAVPRRAAPAASTSGRTAEPSARERRAAPAAAPSRAEAPAAEPRRRPAPERTAEPALGASDDGAAPARRPARDQR